MQLPLKLSVSIICYWVIEGTIGLVLGPSTALYEPFLKQYTLTNKAVGIYDGPCPNLLRGDKVLIFVPSDC